MLVPLVPIPLVDFLLGDTQALCEDFDLLRGPTLVSLELSHEDLALGVVHAHHDALA